MAFVVESEAVSVEYCLQPWRRIDEKRCVGDLVFILEFSQKHRDYNGGSRRKQPDVEQAIYIGIDSGIQPEVIGIDLNHGFVEGDVIRAAARRWL